MIGLIYFVCLLGASIIQVLLRSLLANGTVPFIPGTVIIYFIALGIARKWSNSYKEKKEMQKEQNKSNEHYENPRN